DSNNDGTFENIGSVVRSANATGAYTTYDPVNLAAGTYNTKVIITDINGLQRIAHDTLTVSNNVAPWSVSGLDSIDSDGVYGGTDSNITNFITQGTSQVTLTAGVNNPRGIPLTYQFQIDSNNDGIFENISGATTNLIYTNASVNFNSSSLTAGIYQTKVIITDTNGLTQFQEGTIKVTEKTWSVNGLDAFDNQSLYADANDPSAFNIAIKSALPETDHIHMTVGVNNPTNSLLTYQFQIDSNNDGVFETFRTVQDSGNNVRALYDPRGLADGNYNVRVVISDVNGISRETYDVLTVASTNPNPITPGSWSVTGLDSIDSDGIYGGLDSNLTNTVTEGINSITLTAGVNNPSGNILKYQFMIDSDNNSTYENIQDIQKSASTNGLAIKYDPSGLAAGTYNTKVIVTDSNGISYDKFGSFTIEVPPSTGLDSIDSDGVYGGADSNTSNTIQQGTTQIRLAAGINNPYGASMKYEFQIDSNKDGTFETFNTIYTTDKAGASANYDPSLLQGGTYNTRVVISDANNVIQTENSQLIITPNIVKYPWSIQGIDSIDIDAVYGGLDSNSTNTIGVGTQFITMTAGVYNPYSQALIYTFQIDSNNDGVFESVGQSASNTGSAYIIHDVRNLAAGSYNTKVQIADAFGNNKQESFGTLIVSNGSTNASSAWSATDIDSIDADGIFGGTDSNVTNTISQGTADIRLTAGVENPYKLALTYRFQADLNNDGNFEDIQTISSVNTYGAYIDLRTIDLAPNTYNTRVIISDVKGTSYTVNDNFVVQAKTWSLNGLDSIDSDSVFGGADSNSINTIDLGTSQINMVVGVSNTQGANLTYKFEVDLNKNGIFDGGSEVVGIANSSSNIIPNWMLNTANLSAGNYSTRVTVTDVNNLSYSVTDSFKVTAPAIQGFDSIDSDRAFGGVDSNLNNEIAVGSTLLSMTVGVSNTNNAVLIYYFNIDLNNDGDFSDAGENVDASSSSSSLDTFFDYNPDLLVVNTYNTRVVITDSNGVLTGSVDNSFRII
ncbi:MAG: beta strand repeat-containing protein, partial [Candidatus Melainabacteria bacterium]